MVVPTKFPYQVRLDEEDVWDDDDDDWFDGDDE